MWGAMTPPPSVMCPPSMIDSNKGLFGHIWLGCPPLNPLGSSSVGFSSLCGRKKVLNLGKVVKFQAPN